MSLPVCSEPLCLWVLLLHDNLVYCTADKDPKCCSSIHCHVWYTTMYTYTQTLFIILSLLFPSALSLITAPVNQYVVEGEDIRPECSFDDPSQVYGLVIITIRRNGQPTPIISGATVEDEGEYLCDVSLFSHDASTQVPFTLHVFSECNTSPSVFFIPHLHWVLFCNRCDYNYIGPSLLFHTICMFPSQLTVADNNSFLVFPQLPST